MGQRISILGATGSVGRQAADLLCRQSHDFEVVALTGHSNADELLRQARLLRPKMVVCGTAESQVFLTEALNGEGIEVAFGPDALLEAAGCETDVCLAAISGKAGLAPSVAALGNCRRLALATKESLVAAGDLFMRSAHEQGTEIVPLDSEHHAIGRLLQAHGMEGLRRVVLTASGGPFREHTRKAMAVVMADEAATHPKWKMGRRISIDSASMFNKAIEIIEAHHLFGLPSEKIDVLIHPQSLVHGLVEYESGQFYAQLALPRMALVIGEALGWAINEPQASEERIGLSDLAQLTFAAPDEERFPALRLAREVLASGRPCGVCANRCFGDRGGGFCRR